MRLHYSKNFKKQFKKLPLKMQERFEERLVMFLEDENDKRLAIHKLSGKMKNLWSFSVTGGIRVVFDKNFSGVVYFIAIGSHSELYE